MPQPSSMQNRWQQYKALELISSDQPSRQSSAQRQPMSWFSRLWDAIDAALFRSLESRVWQSVDPQSRQACWHFYDPETGQTRHLHSEAELRLWLQQLYEWSG